MLSRVQSSLLQGLQRRRVREREGLFLAEGVRVVEDLLATGIDLHLAVVSSSLGDSARGGALRDALAARTSLVEVADHELERLAATETPQGVLVAAHTPQWSLEAHTPAERETLLVLDAVQDPGNLGTMLRTADALGAAMAICLPGTVDPWNPKAVRSAAGSAFRLPTPQVAVESLAEWARGHQFRLVGADADGTPVEELASGPRTALVVGNEGAGLGPEVRARLDGLVSIRIRGEAESLNVAVAAGILLYTFTR